MSAPKMLTPLEAYNLIRNQDILPGGTYKFCIGVLELWQASPVDQSSAQNLVFMLSSVFAAGYEYARREEQAKRSNAR